MNNTVNILSRLQFISNILLDDHTDYFTLREAMQEYKTLLLDVTQLDLGREDFRSDRRFANGKALGTSWAVMCIDDIMRTKRFVKGLADAVKDKLQQQEGPIHILYAGCGPFATLVLPIFMQYSHQEVQCTLVEVNELTFEIAHQTINRLGLSEYIHAFVKADASVYQIEDKNQIDIVLSETMQVGLREEQQVSIALNLMSQVNDEVVLIPEKISIDLGLNEVSMLTKEVESARKDISTIGTVFELSKESIRHYSEANTEAFFPRKTFHISAEMMAGYNQLVLLTGITVYGNHRLFFQESGLTIPIIFHQLDNEQTPEITVHTQYKIGANPGVDYRLEY